MPSHQRDSMSAKTTFKESSVYMKMTQYVNFHDCIYDQLL